MVFSLVIARKRNSYIRMLYRVLLRGLELLRNAYERNNIVVVLFQGGFIFRALCDILSSSGSHHFYCHLSPQSSNLCFQTTRGKREGEITRKNAFLSKIISSIIIIILLSMSTSEIGAAEKQQHA